MSKWYIEEVKVHVEDPRSWRNRGKFGEDRSMVENKMCLLLGSHWEETSPHKPTVL
jgi:hypothetical protein